MMNDIWLQAVDEIIMSKSPETQRSYRAAWGAWLDYLDGRPPWTTSRDDVLGWVRFMKRENGYRQTTMATRLASCAAIWHALQERGLIDPDTDNIFRVAGTGLYVDQCLRRAKPLTEDQADRLLGSIRRHTVHGARDYALIGMLLATGARPGEMLAMRVGDVGRDEAGAVAVVGGRSVPIPMEMYDAVQDYLALAGRQNAQVHEYLWQPLRDDEATRFGRDLPADRPISGQQLRNIVQRRRIMAGITGHYTVDSLRKTFVRALATRSTTLEELRRRLGHAQPVTTRAWLAV